MTRDEYVAMKNERDTLAKSIVHLIGEENHLLVKQLMTLTRILDRAAAEYAEHADDAQYEGRNEQA
jgi:hypothetical protein